MCFNTTNMLVIFTTLTFMACANTAGFLVYYFATDGLSTPVFGPLSNSTSFNGSSCFGSLYGYSELYLVSAWYVACMLLTIHVAVCAFRLSRIHNTAMYTKVNQFVSDLEESVVFGDGLDNSAFEEDEELDEASSNRKAVKIESAMFAETTVPIRELIVGALDRALTEIRTTPLVLFFYGFDFLCAFLTFHLLCVVAFVGGSVPELFSTLMYMAAVTGLLCAVQLVRMFTKYKYLYDFDLNMLDNATQGTRMDVYLQIAAMNVMLGMAVTCTQLAAISVNSPWLYYATYAGWCLYFIFDFVMTLKQKAAVKHWFGGHLSAVAGGALVLAHITEMKDPQTDIDIVSLVFISSAMIVSVGTIAYKAYIVNSRRKLAAAAADSYS